MPSRSGSCCKNLGGKRQQAIMVDGQRYTCEKCRKGHRTGTCTHLVDEKGNPRLLQKTNRAGRPNTTSKCRCPSSDQCTCVKTWYLVVRIPKSEIEPGMEGENNCRIVGTVVKPLREDIKDVKENQDIHHGGTLIASSAGPSGHQCNCGDTCACTYCPKHPDNQATHDHNQFLANQNRPLNSTPRPEKQLVQSSSQACGGTAEVTYACSSDDSAAGQEAMLSTIPLNDQNYHYQVYSGQYPRGRCGRNCRCLGCITWRVGSLVKQQLAMRGYMLEDCPPKCNCTGCLSHRDRGGIIEFPILSLEEFDLSTEVDGFNFGAMLTSIASPTNIGVYDGGTTASTTIPDPYQLRPLHEPVLPVQPQMPHLSPMQYSDGPFFSPYLDAEPRPFQAAHNSSDLATVAHSSPLMHPSPIFVSENTMNPYR